MLSLHADVIVVLQRSDVTKSENPKLRRKQGKVQKREKKLNKLLKEAAQKRPTKHQIISEPIKVIKALKLKDQVLQGLLHGKP